MAPATETNGLDGKQHFPPHLYERAEQVEH